MKKQLLLSVSFILLSISIKAQFTFSYNGQQYSVLKTSIFKDSLGKEYNYNEMSLVMMGGEYEIIPANPRDASKGFLIVGINKEEQLRRAAAAPKPIESTAFKTGKKFENFSAYDLDGKLVDTKQLKGKILVINFWFINCPPCRAERPYLNQIVNDYKSDSNVVFIAIALDLKEQLQTYLKEHEFNYNIIPDGRKIAASYDIKGFPTQVIVDNEGKVAFHSVSYNYVTGYWMRKTIDELKAR